MRRAILLMLAVFLLVSTAYADDTKKLEVEFVYHGSGQAEAVEYHLYMDYNRQCGVLATDVVDNKFECKDITVTPGTHTFTMTATTKAGEETAHSPKFPFTITPDAIGSTTIITISVTNSDGTVIVQ